MHLNIYEAIEFERAAEFMLEQVFVHRYSLFANRKESCPDVNMNISVSYEYDRSFYLDSDSSLYTKLSFKFIYAYLKSDWY